MLTLMHMSEKFKGNLVFYSVSAAVLETMDYCQRKSTFFKQKSFFHFYLDRQKLKRLKENSIIVFLHPKKF